MIRALLTVSESESAAIIADRMAAGRQAGAVAESLHLIDKMEAKSGQIGPGLGF